MAKQAEIGEIKTHRKMLPSYFAKLGFIYCPLWLVFSTLFFRQRRNAGAARCLSMHSAALRQARGLDRNDSKLLARRRQKRIRMMPMAETSSLERRAPAERPLSPHLQIYRPMLTMMMSIVHRITGFGLYFGMLLLAWWLIAAASPNGYARFQWFASSWIGRLILFGYTWALIHHMLGGVRHLIWDTGRGLGPQEREWLVAANLIGSIVITLLLWMIGLLIMGGPQ
jgi:succinate dehydrogenase / fumarate reductase, cytochrome b subunit